MAVNEQPRINPFPAPSKPQVIEIKSYYNKLRHGAAPLTQRHRDFSFALQRYVYHKLRAKRLERHHIAHTEESLYHARERDKWRNLMDQIEFGLSYSSPVASIATDSIGQSG